MKYTLLAILGVIVLFIAGLLVYSILTPDKADVDRNSAYVNSVEAIVLESFPVQVKAVIKGELPDTCTTIDVVEVKRQGATFNISLTTARPKDVMCAEVVSPFTEEVSLEVRDLPKGTYTISANGVTDTFELFADNTMGDVQGAIESLFTQYAVTDLYDGKTAEPKFTKPEEKEFETTIKNGMSAGVNFAGRYVLIEWSCGVECQNHAIVDAETGAISHLGLKSQFGIQFRKNSALIVVNPPGNIPAEAQNRVETGYFFMQEGILNPLTDK